MLSHLIKFGKAVICKGGEFMKFQFLAILFAALSSSPDDRGMVLRVFEKSAHTKPVLALYKSLLKLSSNKSLDPVLTARLQRRIRNGFRKNQKIFSARLVKTNLINAFNVPPHHPALANRRYIPS
jgi:Complex 1 protein (LYR family)